MNRQVMELRREGVVTLNGRNLTIHEEERPAEISGYTTGQHLALRPIDG